MDSNKITMTNVQLRRFEVLSQLNSQKINGTEASEKLGLCLRQIRRLKKKVKEKGAKGLLHGNFGKVSNQKMEKAKSDNILKLLQTSYKNFGPTFVAEKLEERNQIKVSNEWLRGFMTTEELWIPKKKKDSAVHHSWRPRMDLVGTMEQFDGSYHKWITGLDEEQCLLLSIDDATGNITKAHFDYHEGITPVFTFWKEYAETHKYLPKRLYVDKFSTYKVNHKNAQDEPEMMTQFERSLKTLGVELICANSPQAKGRVERVFGTLQDRLVKEMFLAGVKNITKANIFLQKYILKFNAQFGVKAGKIGNGFVPILSSENLESVFSIQEERKVQNDFTIRFENVWYQIQKEQSSSVLRNDLVIIEKRLDGSIAIRLMRTNDYLQIEKLPMRPVKLKSLQIIPANTRTKFVPSPTHPWRNYAKREIAVTS